MRTFLAGVLVALSLGLTSNGLVTPALAASSASPSGPDLGSSVYVFNSGMPLGEIQATVDSIAARQVSNQFGTDRYALLFEPGVYGSAKNPLNFQIGYYTAVAGLGLSPDDVVINGSVNVYNQCLGAHNCIALVNFWRSLSNLTINVATPGGCHYGEFWAVSQAAPMRRVHVNGFATLMDYCSSPAFASGGFIADSAFDGSTVVNGSQQQWFTRNSRLDGWTNGVWNQVFSGVVGAPAQCFPSQKSCGGPYTTLATSPLTREEPFLYRDSAGHYQVFVPALQHNSRGTSWSAGATAGSSLPIQSFFIARPADSAQAINGALRRGENLLLTPGVYHLDQALRVERPDTVVLGLGFPTLVPESGDAAMRVADAQGVLISGIIFDAGPESSPVLLQVGTGRGFNDGTAADPSALQDVFFRIGGATAGEARTSLVVNTDDVILDDIWAWRADHGAGVGWTANTADTGVVVNGDDVTAYGLFVEHYQKFEVIWNGDGGRDVFFQNEMPYDPPGQDAWMEAPGVDGWAAFKVGERVTSFTGYGMGSYSFFNQGVNIYAANAFEVPTSLPKSSLNDLLTIFLSRAGFGGILNVVNGVGGSSTIANPDTVVPVVAYP